MRIQLKILNKEFYTHCPLPNRMTLGSAGCDLYSPEVYVIEPGQTVEVGLGIAIHIGSGYDYAQKFQSFDYTAIILPRSSIGLRGLYIKNTMGIIDADYQGELKVYVSNSSRSETYTLKKGERFAQLLIVPIASPDWDVVDEFTNTTGRGADGFGSTG